MYQIIRQDIPLGWEYAGSTEVDVDIFVMFLVEIIKMFMLFFPAPLNIMSYFTLSFYKLWNDKSWRFLNV